MAELTYYVFKETKSVTNAWGYCHNWKSHLKVAEKLGYRLTNDYGFSVDTVNKKFFAADKLVESVMNGTRLNWNDSTSVYKILEAWRYLKKKGYTTDSEIIKKYEKVNW